MSPDPPVPPLAGDPDFFRLVRDSHADLVGRPLAPAPPDAAWLYMQAPFALLAHDGAADPRFV